MTLAQMAALHARCFTTPRPWSEAEMAEVLGTQGAFLLLRPSGFLIGRVIADEAELLTLAVAPEARRQGTGRALLDEFARAARQRGAVSAFLEVAADNAPALSLYHSANWVQAGLRKRYFGPELDGLILRLAL